MNTSTLTKRLQQSSDFTLNARDGVDDALIQRAETRLGKQFSPSYRWFLRTFGSGYYLGYAINGIAPPAHTGSMNDDILEFTGDIVACHELNSTRSSWNPAWLEILSVEGDELFVFDTSVPNSSGEYPVLLITPTSRPKSANEYCDFYDFLRSLL